MPSPPAFHKRYLLALMILIVVESAVFWSTTSEFLTPDGVFYLARPLRDWSDVRNIFWRLDDRDNYRPLTYLIATPLYWWAGLDPYYYHVFMILLHALVTALVFWFAWLVLKSAIGAIVVAAFFGLHGAASHVTFDIAFLPDVSYGLFFLVGLISFLRFERKSSPRWYAASLISFFLSLLSKEPAVTFPAAIFLLLVLVPGLSRLAAEARLDWRQALVRTVPFWLLGILYLAWFGVLSQGRFVPEDPKHPYFVSLSLESLQSKGLYAKWAVNLRGHFATIADHPSINAAVMRFFPDSVAAFFSTSSDFVLYLIGPLWLLWLGVTGKGKLISEILLDSLLTPLIVMSLLALGYATLKSRRNEDQTICYGALFFAVVLSPVLVLPKDKTMMHNLYLPVIGLGIMLGGFIRDHWIYSGHYWRKAVALIVPFAFVAGGLNSIKRNLNEGWPVTSAWKSHTYLHDLQVLFPKFDPGTILYFDKTGNHAWPWFTDAGNLLRVYYKNPTLIALFGDYGHELPTVGPDQTLVRLRDTSGHLAVVEEKKSEIASYWVELLDPQKHEFKEGERIVADRASYYVRGNELTFKTTLTAPSYTIIIPHEFRITHCSEPVLVTEEVDGRLAVRIRGQGGRPLILRARRFRIF